MSDQLPSGILVTALMRQVNDAGGTATMLVRGDAQAGAILIICCEKGRHVSALERGIGPDGRNSLVRSGPGPTDSSMDIAAYRQKRQHFDPDLWVIELDIPDAERFVARVMLEG